MSVYSIMERILKFKSHAGEIDSHGLIVVCVGQPGQSDSADRLLELKLLK